LARRRGVPESEISVPEDIIFTYDHGIFRTAIARTGAVPVDWYIYRDRFYRAMLGSRPLGIVLAMTGASAASMNLEELVAYGAKRIYELGLSGAIDTNLEPGDVVVLAGALSDEGTSGHYYRASSRFSSSSNLTKKLRASLRKSDLEHSLGDAWTIDAPYRETAEKVVSFRRKGARVVNMESSAIFAVAIYRGIEAASVQIVSDVVSEKEWNPAFHREIVDRRRGDVLEAVLRSIRR
jgi:uridine phosphorylase